MSAREENELIDEKIRAEISLALDEGRKFRAEAGKLMEESFKLRAEGNKMQAERNWLPVAALAASLAAIIIAVLR